MATINSREQELRKQIEILKAQLDEPRQTVEALRNGEVDAVVVTEHGRDADVYTLNRCVHFYELEDIARAIQEGSVDALVMRGEEGEAVFTLHTVQEALRRSEERLRVAVKNSEITVYTTDRDLRYTWVENLPPGLHPQAVLGKRDDELLPPEVAAPIMQLKQDALELESGRRGEVDVLLDGRRHIYDLTIEPERRSEGTVVGLICAARDITQRKLLEEERARHAERLANALAQRTAELTDAHDAQRRAETLAVLGTLSAGIAHDLGNLLLPLRANLDLLRSHANSPNMASVIEQISRNIKYIGDLAQRLRQSMSNSGSGHPVVESLNLHRWCLDSERFFRTIIPPSIALECQVPAELPEVMLDQIGLTQAVYNLIQNSFKAMRKSGVGGRIHVRAFSDEPDRVTVSVKDDGPGMPSDVLAQCLEPQFTTDAESGGTGLGLPLVKAFVESAGGAVEVISPAPGESRGTSVMMRVPTRNRSAVTDSVRQRADERTPSAFKPKRMSSGSPLPP